MSDLVTSKPVEGKSSNNKLALGVILFSVIEAVVGFFLVLKPLFIDSIYHNDYLDEHGYKYAVSFFGNLFMSESDKASGTVMLSLSGAVLNIVLIYLVLTVLPIIMSLFLKKGYAFGKTGLTVAFGAKTVIGLMPLLVPFDNVRGAMWMFGAADAVLCIGACAFFVYLNNVEYADDMALDGDQIKGMVKRAKFGGLLFLMMTALVVCEKIAMGGYGTDRSIIIGKDNQQLMQGYVLVLLLGLSLVCAIAYIRGTEASLYFFSAFGCATAFSNVYALIRKFTKEKSATKNGEWWMGTIFIGVSLVVAAAVGFMAFMKARKKLFQKPAADEKKPALFTWICAGALILCFFLSVVAVLRWDKKLYSTFVMGAMDYMYFIVYGGITLFLALSMLGGIVFSKWGSLALYIVVGASNFTTAFKVLGERHSLVVKNPGYHGYDYLVTGILFILSIICCFTVIILFVYKEIDNYMYNKNNS